MWGNGGDAEGVEQGVRRDAGECRLWDEGGSECGVVGRAVNSGVLVGRGCLVGTVCAY